MGKRAERRKRGVVPFAQIIYYGEKYDTRNNNQRAHFLHYERLRQWYKNECVGPPPESREGGKLYFKPRRCASYEEAISIIVERKLGLVVDHGWRWITPYKVQVGYISKGRKVITKTTVVAKLEIKCERLGVRRDQLSDRLFRKKRGRGFPISEDLEARWVAYRDRQYELAINLAKRAASVRSNRFFGGGRRAKAMVRRRTRPVPVPAPPGRAWRTVSSCIRSPRATPLQQFSNSTLARAQ